MFLGGGFLQLLVGVASLAFAGLRSHCIFLLAARAAAKVSARSARTASLCEMPHVSGRPRFDQVLPGPQVLLRFVRCFVCLIGFGATLSVRGSLGPRFSERGIFLQRGSPGFPSGLPLGLSLQLSLELSFGPLRPRSIF